MARAADPTPPRPTPPRPTQPPQLRLEQLFDETDDNGNGLLDFNEFRTLVEATNPDVSMADVMDLYDHCIQLSSEENGEGTLRPPRGRRVAAA